MLKPKQLVIMAGGASSRMKKSLSQVALKEETKTIAQHSHKSLIPLGEKNRPLLYYHFRMAQQAKVNEVFIITTEENEDFSSFISSPLVQKEFKDMVFHLIPQSIPMGREKPLGTADAVLQAMTKHPALNQGTFVVLNGDNIYSKEALAALYSLPEKQQALIGYARDGLRFTKERIQKFAVLDYNAEHQLTQLIEKPSAAAVEHVQHTHGQLRVSMNIFKLYGPSIWHYLEKCPLHPIRQEKELPVAIQACAQENPTAFLVLPRNEHVPDLTSAEDIKALETEGF